MFHNIIISPNNNILEQNTRNSAKHLVVSYFLCIFAAKINNDMAIAIRPIPVLTGKTAERFERLMEESKSSPYTIIPEEYRQSVRRMLDRSRNVVIKVPKK